MANLLRPGYKDKLIVSMQHRKCHKKDFGTDEYSVSLLPLPPGLNLREKLSITLGPQSQAAVTIFGSNFKLLNLGQGAENVTVV